MGSFETKNKEHTKKMHKVFFSAIKNKHSEKQVSNWIATYGRFQWNAFSVWHYCHTCAYFDKFSATPSTCFSIFVYNYYFELPRTIIKLPLNANKTKWEHKKDEVIYWANKNKSGLCAGINVRFKENFPLIISIFYSDKNLGIFFISFRFDGG